MTVTMIYGIHYHYGWRELPIKLSLTSRKSFLLSAGHSQRHQTREHPASPLTSTWTSESWDVDVVVGQLTHQFDHIWLQL